jgi:hypothetical protein
VANDENPQARTQPNQHKSLVTGAALVVILEQNAALVIENRLGFLKGHAVLPLVLSVLGVVPFKPEHRCTVATL